MLSPQLGTRAVWAGEEEYLMQGATQVPIVHSVSFGYHDMDEWLQVALGQKEGHIYSRNSNPTVDVLEEKIRILEGAQAATSFSSFSTFPFPKLQRQKFIPSLKAPASWHPPKRV